MAPKRSGKVLGTVVRTTRRVVQETVQVSVVDDNQVSTTQEEVNLQPHSKIIPVEDTTPKQPHPPEPHSEPDEPISTPETEDQEQPKQQNGQTVPMGAEKGKENVEIKKKKKRGRRGEVGGGEGYKRYVFRVMKQVHPGMGISSNAMTIINNLMTDMFERLSDEAARLSKYTGRVTLSSREIQGAVKLVLPGELGRHAIAEGTKAVSTYMSHDNTTSKS